MKQSFVEIRDLGEASALVALGFILCDLQPSNTGTFKIFIFEETHPKVPTLNIDEVIEDYQRRKLAVDAQTFFRSLTEMKRKIYSHTNKMALDR